MHGPLWRIRRHFSRGRAHPKFQRPLEWLNVSPHPTNIASCPIPAKNGHKVTTRHASGREHAIGSSVASVRWSARSSELHNDTYSGRRLPKSGRNTNQFSKSTPSGDAGHIRGVPIISLFLSYHHLPPCVCCHIPTRILLALSCIRSIVSIAQW